jgi:hypothetical protein
LGREMGWAKIKEKHVEEDKRRFCKIQKFSKHKKTKVTFSQ